jgi:hypothetical protein
VNFDGKIKRLVGQQQSSKWENARPRIVKGGLVRGP